jgi:hypothetical protein
VPAFRRAQGLDDHPVRETVLETLLTEQPPNGGRAGVATGPARLLLNAHLGMLKLGAPD